MAKVITPENFSLLAQLNSEYWHRVDHPGEREVADLYSDDGEMVFDKFHLTGRAEIRSFFQARNAAAHPRRVTRHITSNLYLDAIGEGEIAARSVVTVYAGLGAPPFKTSSPTSVLDFHDICHFSEGRWRYKRRSGHLIFVGPGAAPFLIAQLPADHPLRATEL